MFFILNVPFGFIFKNIVILELVLNLFRTDEYPVFF